jgi:concanavalin A-like lectin/glucanase superfamily protein
MRRWWAGMAGTGVLTAAVTLLGGAGQAGAAGTLAAQWHMNESAGATTMADSSGHNNNGTLHSVTAGVPGKVGTAYRFGGSAVKSYVEVPDSPSLNPNAAKINISVWFNTTSLPTSGDYDLVRKGDFPGQEYKVELLQGGIINCEFLGASGHVVLHGGSGLADGKWHHINCIAGPTGEKLQLGGTAVASSTTVVGSISNITPVEIGAHPGSDWYKGRLDEVSITVG